MAASFLKRKPKEPDGPQRQEIPVLEADAETGLSAAQAQERLDGGWGNAPVESPGASVREIIAKNVFTYFNFLFFLLAGCVIAVRQWLNLTFLGPVFCNMFIGIVQDLRVKKKVDGLKIMAAPKCRAVRDGQIVELDAAQLVRDDIAVFSPGDQIPADAVVAAGECRVNEALVTGEADEIVKKPGERLLSGSFVVSGSCRARLTAVGVDSFVSRLTLEAKQTGSQPQSEMMHSLTSLIKWIGFLVIPLGAVMFIKEYLWLKSPITDAVTSTVGSIVGMIPEGLYLLTSLALVASVIRLANRRTLVHDMGCIETLARVDTLCVDKTGTITEPKMTVDDVVPLQPERYIADDIRMIMADYVCAMQDDNDTMAALREAKKRGGYILSIVNVVGSSIARESDDVLYTWAGPEIAVATTKAYSTQMAVLDLLAVYLAAQRNTISAEEANRLTAAIAALPAQVEQILSSREQIQYYASQYFNHDSVFFIGRNLDYALGMEGSLKLKEISYIHSEAYASGELKHGTISLIEPGTLVIALGTYGPLFDKAMSNVIEVKARGASVLALTTENRREALSSRVDGILTIPETELPLLPLLGVVPLQLFAYYVALQRGCDIDKPRNLAKSVTVE